jgi:uncharacterized protein YkwD/uncharacterized membrane protein required for colicin V production
LPPVNAVDVAILTLVGLLAVLGMRRGFLLGTLDLLGVAAALAVAALYYRRLIDPLADWGLARGTAAIVAFAALNVAAQAVVSLLTGVLFRPLSRLPWPWPVRWSDGVLGLIPGAVKGLAIAAVVVLPLAFLQRPVVLSDEVRSSRLADPLIDTGLDVLYGAVDRWDVQLADFAAITSRPAGGAIDLPFTVTTGLTTDQALEREMLELVNAERAAAGLDPVEPDAELAGVARAHAAEMFRLGYFAHESPVTGHPGDRLAAADVAAIASGENLAYAPTLRVAHEGLMNSPGHRANILNPVYTRLGVGVVRSENRGIMFVQEFAA